MGIAKRKHREAVIAGTEPPIVNTPTRRRWRSWICANCHKPLLRGTGIVVNGYEFHVGCPKVMKPKE